MPGLGPPNHEEIVANFFGPDGATTRIVQSFDDIPSTGCVALEEAQLSRADLLSAALRGILPEFKRRTSGCDLSGTQRFTVNTVLEELIKDLYKSLTSPKPAVAQETADDGMPDPGCSHHFVD